MVQARCVTIGVSFSQSWYPIERTFFFYSPSFAMVFTILCPRGVLILLHSRII